jgi:protein SCO1/2
MRERTLSLAGAIALLLATSPTFGGPPRITDVSLVDQNGTSVRFYSDLVRHHVVAINFVFTSCTTICTSMGANFAALQALAGKRDVTLISVSIDPRTDTPERLKSWSEKFHARPGWTLVTGDRTNVDRLLKDLGVYTASPADHSPIILVGNDRTGCWTRTNGLAAPAKLLTVIDEVAASTACK